jgi:hypothetical protein
MSGSAPALPSVRPPRRGDGDRLRDTPAEAPPRGRPAAPAAPAPGRPDPRMRGPHGPLLPPPVTGASRGTTALRLGPAGRRGRAARRGEDPGPGPMLPLVSSTPAPVGRGLSEPERGPRHGRGASSAAPGRRPRAAAQVGVAGALGRDDERARSPAGAEPAAPPPRAGMASGRAVRRPGRGYLGPPATTTSGGRRHRGYQLRPRRQVMAPSRVTPTSAGRCALASARRARRPGVRRPLVHEDEPGRGQQRCEYRGRRRSSSAPEPVVDGRRDPRDGAPDGPGSPAPSSRARRPAAARADSTAARAGRGEAGADPAGTQTTPRRRRCHPDRASNGA